MLCCFYFPNSYIADECFLQYKRETFPLCSNWHMRFQTKCDHVKFMNPEVLYYITFPHKSMLELSS